MTGAHLNAYADDDQQVYYSDTDYVAPGTKLNNELSILQWTGSSTTV